ncbi:MAG: hypothetical protein IJX94_01250 [Clostridia bacterium]|nr:hypothetical protein [Clostridia bacterium]
MTYDQIIKALHCCSEYEECCRCPCKNECGDLGVLTGNALDLITRQKAEIERLTAELKGKDITKELRRDTMAKVKIEAKDVPGFGGICFEAEGQESFVAREQNDFFLILDSIQEAVTGPTIILRPVSKKTDDRRARGQVPEIKRTDVLRDALATLGLMYQSDRAIEEMSELTKAICKERRAITESEISKARENIIEELADVYITLRQLFIVYGGDALQRAVDEKIGRLAQTLQKAHKEGK